MVESGHFQGVYHEKFKEGFQVIYPNRVMSSRILMEEMGGPESLMAALGSDFKVSINRMHAKRCQRIKMVVGLTKVRQSESITELCLC